ncbi:MAG TPA: GAF domain-containing protein [Phycisphaerae bacterium]|jgi:putative methionine-R-sulfoxide reductase with GAF domain
MLSRAAGKHARAKSTLGNQPGPRDNSLVIQSFEAEFAAALTAHDPSAALADALMLLGTRFAAVSGTIHVMGSDGLLHLVASFGVPPALLPVVSRIPLGKGIAGAAAQRRAPVTICNLQSDSSGVARPAAKFTGVEGAIAVPVMDADELVGVLGLGKPHVYTYSSDETEQLLQWGRRLLPQLRAAR